MGGSEHPGVLYFYSESIGFGVNGVCAFIAALTNLGVGERDVSTAVLFIIIGGVMQLLCKFCMFTMFFVVILNRFIDTPVSLRRKVLGVFRCVMCLLQYRCLSNTYHIICSLISLSPQIYL